MPDPLPDVADDDVSHPIPHLGKIDVVVPFEHGAYYGIVVSEPLSNDELTRARLLKKIENYLGDFHSDEFKMRHGTPLPGKLRIYVGLTPGAARGIFELLEQCRAWLADNNVILVIKSLDDSEEEPNTH